MAKNLTEACKRFIKEWPHFIKCINMNYTNMDARAIRFFNEVPGEIETALKEARKEPT